MLSWKSPIHSPLPWSPTHPLPLPGPGVPLYWDILSLQDQWASLPNDGRLGHLLLHMQLETWALGVLVSSYCCSTYRVADHFSSLGTFSSSAIRGPEFHPIDDYEHPHLYLTGTCIASHETIGILFPKWNNLRRQGPVAWTGLLHGGTMGLKYVVPHNLQ